MSSSISKRKATSIASGQSSSKRVRGRKPSVKFEDEAESDELRYDDDDDDDDEYRGGDSDYDEVEKKPSTKKKGRGGQSTKKKSLWKAEEDNYMIDCILEEMPSPSWKHIAKGLAGRTPNSCLVRWKTLQKRLYQNN
ncbi:hypothetical protein C2G38_2083610 [Gigaspora rosea]|uniref:Uncharacterized protein n=1 Tax=Gigaspora rosea TaxID=44941 RepID=A0A397VIX3_9GLOM|nr:hypothetical protein C2G38_2083610 [Gigaspora rosea]